MAPGGFGEAAAQCRVGGYAEHGMGHGVDVAWRHEDACFAVAEDFGRAGWAVGRDYRESENKGFCYCKAETFVF